MQLSPPRQSGISKPSISGTGEDYTTDVVPLSERRSPATLGLLWLTMVTGFPTVLVGFEWFKAGLTLPQILQCTAISCMVLMAYGIPATYLGSKSGQTYCLLSRRVFGCWGSRLVSVNLVCISTAWYGLTAVFLASGLKGIYHMDISTMWFAAGLAILMAFNNFFGFTGIANFARYLAAPVLIAWVGYTFFKAAGVCPSSVFAAHPTASFAQSLTIVSAFTVGYGVWGNEADYWRYGKPKKMLSAAPLFIALLIGQVMFPITGWMMASMTGITEMGAATNLMNQYAFGGVSTIAALVLVITYIAVNDSGLYGAINGCANLKKMPRKTVVAFLAIVSAVAAACLANMENAFELVATMSSVVLPSATVVMLIEYFVVKPHFEKDSRLGAAPSFDQLPSVRWPAVIAITLSFFVGVATSGLIPALSFLHVGVCSLQSWLVCAVSYCMLRIWEHSLSKRKQLHLEDLYADRLLATSTASVQVS